MKLFEHPVLQNLNGRRLSEGLRYHVPQDTDELNDCARVMRNAMNQPMYYRRAVDGDSMIFLLKDTTSDEYVYAVFVEEGKLTYLLGRSNSLLNNENPGLAKQITEAFIADGVVTVSAKGMAYNVVLRGAYASKEEIRAIREQDNYDDRYRDDDDDDDDDNVVWLSGKGQIAVEDDEEDEDDDRKDDILATKLKNAPAYELSDEDREWEQMKPVGREAGSDTEFDEDIQNEPESSPELSEKPSKLHIVSSGISKVFAVIADITAPKKKSK